MADSKLVDLGENTAPPTTSIVYVVTDPDGVAADAKVQIAKLFAGSCAIVSNPGSGEYRITNIRLDADLKMVITYDDVAEP
jgi:hypothetical protein